MVKLYVIIAFTQQRLRKLSLERKKMIVLAAIKKDGIVYIGQRHSDILCNERRPFGFLKNGIQGFVDQEGKFYNRHDAAKHAFTCGQLPHDKTCPDIIVSEDLW